jgi:cyclophilin family peptidyl-prolyl cis-trans isomerase
VTGPDGASEFQVTATVEPAVVFEGGTTTLMATATGGIPPYAFRWEQSTGPTDVAIFNSDSAEPSTEPLTAFGLYAFRVVATDASGAHAAGFVNVQVSSAFTTVVPVLAIIGEPTELAAALMDTGITATFEWAVVRGSATVASPGAAVAALTTSAAETVVVELAVTVTSGGTAPATTARQFEIASVADRRPRVLLETTNGDFSVALDGEAAPVHTANFLLYVDEGFYDGLLIHRVACSPEPEGECEPFVIQGGGYRRADGELEEVAATRAAVVSEAGNGLSNGMLYSVALALRGGDSGSGTTQFFVNLDEDNARLDDLGFTVFGEVVEAQEVVDAIARVETTVSPVLPGETSLPLEDIIIQRASRLSNSD